MLILYGFMAGKIVKCAIMGTGIFNPENIFFIIKFSISKDGYPGKLEFIFLVNLLMAFGRMFYCCDI